MNNYNRNLSKTKNDIKEYLTKLLNNTNNDTVYTIRGSQYIKEKQFTSSLYIYAVYKNINNNNYYWYVYKDTADTFSDFPQISYNTYESLIENITEYYYKLWKL